MLAAITKVKMLKFKSRTTPSLPFPLASINSHTFCTHFVLITHTLLCSNGRSIQALELQQLFQHSNYYLSSPSCNKQSCFPLMAWTVLMNFNKIIFKVLLIKSNLKKWLENTFGPIVVWIYSTNQRLFDEN